MQSEWVAHCLRMSRRKADFYSGARKIIRAKSLSFHHFDDSLTLADAGYTSSKMRYLERGYLHEESRAIAVQLWDRRRHQAKYGSVGVTTYNHFIKNDPNKKSKRASVMGPCIQAVTLTWLSKTEVSVDLFYRTTELFKKFPADLVFVRDVLLKPFDLSGMTVVDLNCHFANITVHPMYFVTIIPLIDDPVEELIRIGERDPYFRDWIVKWTARYTCEEYNRGIQKFAQAMRVAGDAHKRIGPRKLKALNEYLRDTHPGYRGDYVSPEEEDDD